MPARRTESLHHHRLSVAGAAYFVTCATSPRKYGLTNRAPALSLGEAARASDFNGETTTFAFTVMPDHCHWLFQLRSVLPLGRVIAKFKFFTKLALQTQDIAWQRDFYEHVVRSDENLNAIRAYIQANPARWAEDVENPLKRP